MKITRYAGLVCLWLSVLVARTELSAAELQLVRLEEDEALVGGKMTLAVRADDAGDFRYRFRVRAPQGEMLVIRDFGPDAQLEWAAEREGVYEIEASRLDLRAGNVETVTTEIHAGSRIVDGHAVVTATEHPLVFLFSAPVCETGARMRIRFEPQGGGRVQQTPYLDCTGVESMNFYLAGLYGETDYVAQAVVEGEGGVEMGESVGFRTGIAAETGWQQTVLQAAGENSNKPLLLSTAGGSQVASDLSGQVVWYLPSPVSFMTSFEPGGYLWGFIEDGSQPVERQVIRKVNLVGRTVLETNAEQVNRQLAARGARPIAGFHHEVRTLPDGKIVALASVEQLLTDVQGPGTVDVLGDMIVVLDRDLQVVWSWDAFDHLDVNRAAVLGEVCLRGGIAGCPLFRLAEQANDWTHGNAVLPTPDGDLLFSARHQDWLIKVHYANGDGDGHVVWKLGKDGDFAYEGEEGFPWFSHQHDGNFVSGSGLLVFDNGNTRVAENGGQGESRGQWIELDEQARTARLLLNANLGYYSQAVGSAQMLGNGRFHFNAGCVPNGRGFDTYALEVNGEGQVVSSLNANTLIYRSIRLTDLYASE